MSTATATDGRSTRWQAHRAARREELVTAALRAISAHGPGAGMEEIAAAAATSKTVIYRHFADKEQLHRAVAERVGARVAAALSAATAGAVDFREGLREVVATYLHLVAEDPHVYRFVMAGSPRDGAVGADDSSGPGRSHDPVTGLSAAVSAELARRIGTHLRAGGLARGAASSWAHGLVGMVRAAADHWQSAGADEAAMSPEQLADHLTDLAWGGLAPALEPRSPGPTDDDRATDATTPEEHR